MMLRAFADDAEFRDVLPDIKVPTLLLYGDTDQRSPLNVASELYAMYSGSTVTTYSMSS